MSQINPEGYASVRIGYDAPKEIALNASLPSSDGANPFANGGVMSETKFSASEDVNAVMSFKNNSSNPKDMPLPLGRGYGEFTQADDSRPRARFQDKVDVDTIEKGNTGTISETGKSHG